MHVVQRLAGLLACGPARRRFYTGLNYRSGRPRRDLWRWAPRPAEQAKRIINTALTRRAGSRRELHRPRSKRGRPGAGEYRAAGGGAARRDRVMTVRICKLSGPRHRNRLHAAARPSPVLVLGGLYLDSGSAARPPGSPSAANLPVTDVSVIFRPARPILLTAMSYKGEFAVRSAR